MGLNVFGVAKAARRGEAGTREENLLSGILAWTCSKAPGLLEAILRRCRPLDATGSSALVSSPREPLVEVATEHVIRLPGGLTRRADILFDFGHLKVVVESKVTPASIDISQIEAYHGWSDADLDGSANLVVVVLSPDPHYRAKEMLEPRSVAVDRTLHLSWREVWQVANDFSGSSDPIESLAGQELKEAIELVPGLKPFTGFESESVEAMKAVPRVKGIEDFFRAIRATLEASSPEFEPRSSGRDRKSHDMPVSLWDGYYDTDLVLPDGVSAQEVYFGPWLRLNEGTFCVYLESYATDGRKALSSILERGAFSEDWARQFESDFSPFKLRIERNVPRILAEIQLENPLLLTKPDSAEGRLPEMVAAMLRFLVQEMRRAAASN